MGRVLFLPEVDASFITKVMRDFVLPVPVMKFGFLAHLGSMFGIGCSIRDLQLANVSGLVATC